MNYKINTKEDAVKAIEELKNFVSKEDNDWITIGYDKIPKETFDKYSCKPFEIQRIKMRKDGKVWNNITWNDAKLEANKLGYRLPTIQEMLVLLDAYKKVYPTNADVNHEEFLGIEELAYSEDVCYEWIDAPSVCSRGAYWSDGAYAGAFALSLDWGTGDTGYYVGFRCARVVV